MLSKIKILPLSLPLFNKRLKFFVLSFCFFVVTGMKLILKDGNFIDISRYSVVKEKVLFEKNSRKYVLPVVLVDINSTSKLAELEGRQFSVFSLSSTVFKEKKGKSVFLFRKPISVEKNKKNDFRLRLETRKETNPFLFEQPTTTTQDEDFIEKIKKKGIILKIDVPIKR